MVHSKASPPGRASSRRAALTDAGVDGGARADRNLGLPAGKRLTWSPPPGSCTELVVANRAQVHENFGGERAASQARHDSGERVVVRVGLMTTAKHKVAPAVRIRSAEEGDIDALMELEHRVFSTDRLSRRSLRRFLNAPSAELLVAEEPGGRLAGTAILLFRPRSAVARLYSIAVAPHMGGRGVASMLLRAAEDCAVPRRCGSLPLEVH